MTLLILAFPARGATIGFTNGSFETVGAGITSSFQLAAGNTTDLPGWTSAGSFLDCVVFPGSASTDTCGNGAKLWPGPTTSPDGGNFYADDGDPSFATTLSQTITNLVPNQPYTVSFWQAAAQFQFFTGATTERWHVCLGSDNPCQDSPIMNNANHGFVNWSLQSLTFTPMASTEVLSFFAVGMPSGLPPVVLLDGVSITAAPEPGTCVLLGVTLLSIGIARMRRKKRA
jgi:hypothetical protein